MEKNDFLSRRNFVLLGILILLLSLGNTLFMYFWQDDFALLFKLQHPWEYAGSFGNDIIGGGAYKYLVTPFVPFFPLFRLSPFPYFLVALVLYMLAAVAFYFFVRVLFRNTRASMYATFLFLSGYVGVDIMFRIINSWQTMIGHIFTFLSLGFFVLFYRRFRKRDYFASLLFYLAAVEFVFVRSHALIVSYFAIDFVYMYLTSNVSSSIFRRLFLSFVRLVPFITIFYCWYLMGENGVGKQALTGVINKITSGNVSAIAPFFSTAGYALVYEPIQSLLHQFVGDTKFGILSLFVFLLSSFYIRNVIGNKKFFWILLSGTLVSVVYIYQQIFIQSSAYWYRDTLTQFSGWIGMTFVSQLILFSVAARKYNQIFSRIIFIGLLIVLSYIFSYFIQYPEATFSTTHRYLSNSLPGLCILVSGLFFVLKSRFHFILSFFGFVFIVLSVCLNFKYQQSIIISRSIPTAQFYSTLTKEIPSISKNSIFYFDIAKKGEILSRFDSFFSVGSMPDSTALAVFYSVDRYDLAYVRSFDEVNELLSNSQFSVQNLYSFYYNKHLENTTNEIRTQLTHSANYQKFEPPVSSLTPTLIQFTLTPTVSLPLVNTIELSDDISLAQKHHFISYLKERDSYYRIAKATSSSEWRGHEIENLLDGNTETPWWGHRINWHDTHKESLQIDLGTVKTISSIAWINWRETLTPTEYDISLSRDNATWSKVKEVRKGKSRPSGERVLDTFLATPSRFVKIDFLATSSDDSPAMSDVEIIPQNFNDINYDTLEQFLKYPLSSEDTNSDSVTIARELLLLEPQFLQISFEDESKMDIPFHVTSDMTKTYEIVVPAGGRFIRSIELRSQTLPYIFVVENIRFKSLTLTEMLQKGIAKRLSVN